MLAAAEKTLKFGEPCLPQEAARWAWESMSLEEILQLLEDMPILPPVENMIRIMQKCTKEKSLVFARRISVLLHEHGLVSNLTLGNQLVQMLTACKGLSDAQDVFEKLPCQKGNSWNILIQGYSDNGDPHQTIQLFDRMCKERVHSCKYIYPAVFKACAKLKVLERGRELHNETVARGFESDLIVGNSLVDMYAKWGSLLEAQDILKKKKRKNAISWNALIAAYADLGQTKEAWACFESMEREGFQPDSGTFVAALKACSLDCSTFKGQQLHICIVKSGWDRELIIGNALIGMYGKCGNLEDAHKVLEFLPCLDLVSWTALMSGYAEHGHAIEAIDAYKRMQTDGFYPDYVTFVCCLKACGVIKALQMGQEIYVEVVKTGLECECSIGCILVDIYAKCGIIDDAQEAFDRLVVRSVIAWTALIAGYADHGRNDVALKLFQQMQEESVLPNAATYTCILRACGNIEAVEKGHHLHAMLAGDEASLLNCLTLFRCPEKNATDCGLQTSQEKLAGALVDMYSRCGNIFDAKMVFDSTRIINPVTCNTLIMGCSRQGESRVVFQLISTMKELGINPDGVTYIALLTTCSHAGLVEIGYMSFHALVKVCSVDFTVEHCNCVIDLCSRTGQYDKASGLLNSMPFQPNLVSFGSMFNVCRHSDLVDLGRQLLYSASLVGKNLAPAVISMSNIYATANMPVDLEIFQEILQRSLNA